MTRRRAVVLLAALAGLAAASFVAAWFLRPAPVATTPDRTSPAGAPPAAPPDRPASAGALPAAPRKSGPAPPAPTDPPPDPLPAGLEPWARLRLLDASTRLPIPADADPTVTMHVLRKGRLVPMPQPPDIAPAKNASPIAHVALQSL